MKRVLVDSSSVILLFKADLLDDLVAVYQVSITPSVKDELTSEERSGAKTFLKLLDLKKIVVASAACKPVFNDNSSSPCSSLDRGEQDTILFYQAGGYDFVITDDGRAAKYCILNEIPFINALLLPKVLYFMNKSTLQQSRDKMADLISLGRYASEVISWAVNCKKESLHFAISFPSV